MIESALGLIAVVVVLLLLMWTSMPRRGPKEPPLPPPEGEQPQMDYDRRREVSEAHQRALARWDTAFRKATGATLPPTQLGEPLPGESAQAFLRRGQVEPRLLRRIGQGTCQTCPEYPCKHEVTVNEETNPYPHSLSIQSALEAKFKRIYLEDQRRRAFEDKRRDFYRNLYGTGRPCDEGYGYCPPDGRCDCKKRL